MNMTSSGGGILMLAYGLFWLTMAIFTVSMVWRAVRALEGIDESLRERNSR